GYDGVFPFAAQDSYGGPEDLAELVDQCHRRGIAAVLDVVYNHLGPDGNHLPRFGPYLTVRYRTARGAGNNLEEPRGGEGRRYYRDHGGVGHVAKALTHGFVFTGQYSEFFGCRRGNDPRGVPAERFVVCAQNHDQVGNRPRGERLSRLVDLEGLKLAAGMVLLSPFVPLLFMGEEYGEEAPFLYFVDHSDPKLVRAVRRGRRAE